MSVAGYDSYRESGITWTNRVPSHWRVVRLRRLVEIKKRIANKEGPSVLSITQKGIKVRDTSSNDGQLASSYAHYQLVEPGDFAMNHMDLLTGWVDISSLHGVTSPDYRVFSARAGADVDRNYLLAVLQLGYTGRTFYALGQGSSHLGRWRLPADAFNDFEVPLPPRAEQSAIAAFLRQETDKIDALVGAQRRLIELLKEKREAVISHAVTKGLDPNAPTKDSGVEWLGEVPADWDVCQLKHLVFFQRGHDLPAPDRRAGDIPIYSSGGLLGYHDEAVACGPAIVTGRYGSIGEFNLVHGPYWPLNTALYSIELHGHPGFTRYVLESLRPLFLMYAAKSAVPGVDRNDVHRLMIAVPDFEEQRDIAEHLDQISSQWNGLLEMAQAAIELLQERRAALISAAVTGKIDVRAARILEDHHKQVSASCVTARKLVGSAVLELVADRSGGGRVKAQKLIYLAEAHAGVGELNGQYLRMAAGPFDGGLIAETESQLERAGQISVEQPAGPGGQVLYKIIGPRGRFRNDLDQLLGDRKPAFDKMLSDVATLDTRGAEAVATLYAVWNDLLLGDDEPTDELIISGFLDDWHPEKRAKFKNADLVIWLAWMRRHDLVPDGQGPRTTTGRLFV